MHVAVRLKIVYNMGMSHSLSLSFRELRIKPRPCLAARRRTAGEVPCSDWVRAFGAAKTLFVCMNFSRRRRSSSNEAVVIFRFEGAFWWSRTAVAVQPQGRH